VFGWFDKRKDAPAAGSDVKSAEPSCSFCSKPRAEVRALIAGPASHICDECIVLCVAILEQSDFHRTHRFQYLIEALDGVLGDMGGGERDPDAAEPIVRAALALAGDDPSALRRLVRIGFARRCYPLVLESVPRIAEDARTFADRLDVAVGLYESGRYDEAAEVLGSIRTEEASERALVELNGIATRLRRDDNLDVVSLERMLLGLDEIEATVDARYASPIAGNRAECLVRTGQPHGAAEILEGLPEPLSALQSMLLGDAHLALGDRASAVQRYRAAADAARGPIGLDAKRRLARASGDPYR
jgi:hypothetical protein